MTDEQIVDLFDKVAGDINPAVDGIIRRAELIGRRRRVRRRAWIAAGNAAALAVVAGVSLLVSTHHAPLGPARAVAGSATRHRGTGQRSNPASGGAGAPSPSASAPPARKTGSASPSPAGSASPSPGGSAGMTPHQMLVTLRSLLPAGSVLSNVNQLTSGHGNLEVDYNDGHGAVDFTVSVFPPGTIQQPTCPDPLWTDEGPRPAGALPISCVTRTPPGGVAERDAVMYADSLGFYGYDIYDERPDGVTVFVQVGNGIVHTLPQVDRAQPPGSMAEWEAVAENPAWHV